jgi:hypothetical protein
MNFIVISTPNRKSKYPNPMGINEDTKPHIIIISHHKRHYNGDFMVFVRSSRHGYRIIRKRVVEPSLHFP